VQGGADSEGRVGIDGAVTFVDQLDDALLVDDDVGAKGPLVGLVLNVVPFQDAVGLEHFAVHIAEEREGDTDLFGEGGVGGGTVQADAEDFGVRGVNFSGGDSSLDRLQLLRSTAGESQDVDGEENVFLATIVAELHGLPLIAKQCEIGSGVADLEGHPGDVGILRLTSQRRSRNHRGQKQPKNEHAFDKDSPF